VVIDEEQIKALIRKIIKCIRVNNIEPFLIRCPLPFLSRISMKIQVSEIPKKLLGWGHAFKEKKISGSFLVI
jgi:hypothetical protein